MTASLALSTIICQASTQDLFDLHDSIDQILEGLDGIPNIPVDVWDGLKTLRDRLDDLQYRTLLTPMFMNMTHELEKKSMLVQENTETT